MFRQWLIPQAKKQEAQVLAEECDVDPFLSLIAISRGYSDPYEFEMFLSEECQINDPYELDEMSEAVQRIETAINDNEKIAVFGDYDCDGVTATVLLVEYLKSRKADVIYLIPNRDIDGYGMNTRLIDEAKAQNVTLIITVDNGINSVDEIDYANSLEIDTVVTDHHLPKEKRPNAYAVVDPHCCDYDIFKDLSGVGVAFKLVCAIEGRSPEEMLPYFADLVAIGTVADVMPIVGENRSIVRFGLEMLNRSRRTGLSALLRVSGCYGKEVTAGVISYRIAPRLNSAGRISDASLSVKLLLEKNYENAVALATALNEQNTVRHEKEDEIFKSAVDVIEQNKYYLDRVIVVDGCGWHTGVIGIVASKIVEKYGKPTIVLSTDAENATGSGRSISGFSLFDALSAVSHLTTRFGGHELAAGVSLSVQNIEQFRKQINSYAKTTEMPFLSLRLDCKLNPKALSVDIVKALSPLKPYGVGNPSPMFGIFNLKVERITPISEGKHLKLFFSRDESVFGGLLFGVTEAEFCFKKGDNVDIAVSLDINEYKGKENLSVIIKDIRPHNLDEDLSKTSIINYEAFRRGDDFSAKTVFPTRNEVGTVFKCVKNYGRSVPENAVVNRMSGLLGIGKIHAAIDVLCELGLMERFREGEMLLQVVSMEKTALDKSETFRFLTKKAGEQDECR